MKKLFLMAALALGLAFVGPGASSDAQAKPHGWHKHHGHGWKHGPRRHYGWHRGRHYGWYKHRRWHGYHHSYHSPRYLYGGRW